MSGIPKNRENQATLARGENVEKHNKRDSPCLHHRHERIKPNHQRINLLEAVALRTSSPSLSLYVKVSSVSFPDGTV